MAPQGVSLPHGWNPCNHHADPAQNSKRRVAAGRVQALRQRVSRITVQRAVRLVEDGRGRRMVARVLNVSPSGELDHRGRAGSCPNRVLGRRSTTTASLKAAHGARSGRATMRTQSFTTCRAASARPLLRHRKPMGSWPFQRIGNADGRRIRRRRVGGQHLFSSRRWTGGGRRTLITSSVRRHDVEVAIRVDHAGVAGLVVAGEVAEIGLLEPLLRVPESSAACRAAAAA